MLFMVIERFKNQDPIPVYKRVRDPGIKFPDLCRELDRAQFRPLLPADGMRRSAAAATMGTSQQPRSRHDIRDRPRRAEQGNPRSRRTVPRRQIAASLARLARFRLRRVPFSTSAVSASRASAVSDKVSDNPVKAMA